MNVRIIVNVGRRQISKASGRLECRESAVWPQSGRRLIRVAASGIALFYRIPLVWTRSLIIPQASWYAWEILQFTIRSSVMESDPFDWNFYGLTFGSDLSCHGETIFKKYC